MKITPIFTVVRSLLTIGYKYNSRKVLGFIATKGDGSNEQGDPYLSCFPDIFSDFSVCQVVHTHFLGRYFNACNRIDNDKALDKY